MRFLFGLLIALSSLSLHAQNSGTVYKDLAAQPIVFDSALDLPDKSHTMALISSSTNLYAEVGCSQNATSGWHAYLDVSMFSKLGNKVGYGYVNFKSNGECQQMLRNLFDHPASYEFNFAPPNYFGSSLVELKVRP